MDQQPALPHPFADRAAAVQEILAALEAGAGIDGCFQRLLALYYQPVYHFFAKRGLAHEDCLDLTQETFLGIYTGIRSFRREAGFDTWLFRIATNAYRKRQRWRGAGKRAGEEVALAAGGEPGPGEVAPVSTAPLPPDETLRRERSLLLRQAIEGLPDQMRKCLALRVYRDLKYREIGAVMRLSTETVKAHLFQARSRLQAVLGGYFDAAFRGTDEGKS